MISALYLHIPFCQHICFYCDFPKVLHNRDWEEKYIPALISEIKSFRIPFDSLKTIYIGGGTPSVLSPSLLEKLLSFLSHSFPSVKEFTIEANPESIDTEKARIRKSNGVNRISLGVESSSPKLLSLLGRKHSPSDVSKAVSILKNNGFKNINLDFIYGIPSETIDDLDKDISFALSQDVQHLSFYSLQIEEGTRLSFRKTAPISDERYRSFYDYRRHRLSDSHFHRYEVSNFSKEGFESRHNLTYWHDEEYYACGVGASGYIGNLRYTNTKSITEYLKGKRIAQRDPIGLEDSKIEYLRLNLRLQEGFSLEDYEKRFSEDFLKTHRAEIVRNKDCYEISSSRFRIKEDYLYTRDSLLLSLI